MKTKNVTEKFQQIMTEWFISFELVGFRFEQTQKQEEIKKTDRQIDRYVKTDTMENRQTGRTHKDW